MGVPPQKLKSSADFWALGVDASHCRLQGFNKSLTSASSVGVNDSFKSWSLCRLVWTPRAQKYAEDFS